MTPSSQIKRFAPEVSNWIFELSDEVYLCFKLANHWILAYMGKYIDFKKMNFVFRFVIVEPR